MPLDRRNLPLSLSLAAAPIIALLLYAASAPIAIQQAVSDGSVIALESGAEVGQSFTAHYPGLSRISVQLDAFTFGDLDRVKFRLAVRSDGAEVQILANDQVERELEGTWIHFDFPPQPYAAPASLRYYIDAESPNGVVLLAHAQDMYPEGERIGAEGDLVFRAGFRPSAEKTLSILLSRIAAGKPGLLGNRCTYILLLIGLYLSCAAFTLHLFRLRPEAAVSLEDQAGSREPSGEVQVQDNQPKNM